MSSEGPLIHIIIYSLYGHIAILAEEEKKAIIAAGGRAVIFTVPETLPAEVVQKMHGKASEYPVATTETLTQADGVLFGVPTRFGVVPAQIKAYLDSTGQLWFTGALQGKPAGVFVSTSQQGGGQETTALTLLPVLAHHGMIFVPTGYSVPSAMNAVEAHGGSAYGAGTLTNSDGSRLPSDLEKLMASTQGTLFTKVVAKLSRKD